VRKYIDLIVGQAGAAKAEPSAEEKAVDLSLTEVDSRIRRWEETIERGLLSLEDSAHRIKELRQEREGLLRRKVDLQRKSRSAVRVLPIRTELMAQYVREMQVRLRDKKIGYKKEFLREILKEIRINGNSVTLKYRLPVKARTPPAGAKNPGKEEFFTLYKWWSQQDLNLRPLACEASALTS
jgi:hypothetical protein